MLIDLHCHTSRYSSCSALTPLDLIQGSRRRGLDAICLTEHDRLWEKEDIRRLGAELGMVVLRGAEVTTELGHVLVYGVAALPPGLLLARALAETVRNAGGLVALAHPARAGMPSLPLDELAGLFDMIEVLNGSDGEAQNRSAEGLARLTPLPGIAGSDCHTTSEVGTVATVLPHAIADERELVEALRLGRHTVRRLKSTARLIEDRV